KRRTVSDKERESNPYTNVQVGINQRSTDARLRAVRTTFRGTRPSRRQSSPSGVLAFDRQIHIIAKREEPSPMNHSILGRLARALQVNHTTKIAVVSERHSKHDRNKCEDAPASDRGTQITRGGSEQRDTRTGHEDDQEASG